jgi:hypothetical protein
MRKGLAAAGVVALITAGSAACGADKTTPQGKVSNAFEKLGKQNTVTLGLGFDGTTNQIYSSMKGEDGFTQADAKLLSSLHISVSASSQKSFTLFAKSKNGKGGAVDFTLFSDDAGSSPLAEIRAVDQKAYLRFDIKGLEKLDTSSDTSGIDEINQFVDGADQLPSSLDSVKAALKGQWISIDPKAFVDLAKSMGGSSDSGSGSSDSTSPLGAGTPTLSSTQQKQLVAGLQKALTKNVTYTDLGSKNGADHVKASVPARQFTKDVATDLAPVLKQIPGFKQSDLTDMEAAKGVPNKTLSVDVAIKGGSISGITFDVAQLDSQSHGALPLALTLDGSAKPITAPAGAKVLNPQDIIAMVMGNSSNNPNSSTGSGTSS